MKCAPAPTLTFFSVMVNKLWCTTCEMCLHIDYIRIDSLLCLCNAVSESRILCSQNDVCRVMVLLDYVLDAILTHGKRLCRTAEECSPKKQLDAMQLPTNNSSAAYMQLFYQVVQITHTPIHNMIPKSKSSNMVSIHTHSHTLAP